MKSFVAISLGLAAGIFLFPAALGLTDSMPAAAATAVLGAVAFGFWMHRRPIVPLDETAAPRPLKILSGIAAILALVVLGRLAVFMVAPSHPEYSSVPSSQWEVRHSCVSAYFVAARAGTLTSNLYSDSLYTSPDDDPTKIRKALRIGPFNIDVYEYPPPFLLLPRALRLVAPEFMHFRMLWFGIYCSLFLLAILLVARMLGPAAGTRALLLSPLIWMALPSLSGLQKGNAQVMIIAASVVAMLLFERRRWAAGGALLAFAMVSKLYPGLLLVYLLAQRQWRAVAWTAAAAVAFFTLSILDLGWASYHAFLQHLPGLMGGEAFPAFRNPAAMAINYSVPGLVFKLKLFGVPGMTFAASKIVGWLYTLVALWVVFLAGTRKLRIEEKPLVWIAILILATLRSPFLPQAYGAVPVLWLLTLLAAIHPPDTKALFATLLGWAALNIMWPMDWPADPRLVALANLIPQTVTIVLAVLVLTRVSAPQREDAPRALVEKTPTPVLSR